MYVFARHSHSKNDLYKSKIKYFSVFNLKKKDTNLYINKYLALTKTNPLFIHSYFTKQYMSSTKGIDINYLNQIVVFHLYLWLQKS